MHAPVGKHYQRCPHAEILAETCIDRRLLCRGLVRLDDRDLLEFGSEQVVLQPGAIDLLPVLAREHSIRRQRPLYVAQVDRSLRIVTGITLEKSRFHCHLVEQTGIDHRIAICGPQRRSLAERIDDSSMLVLGKLQCVRFAGRLEIVLHIAQGVRHLRVIWLVAQHLTRRHYGQVDRVQMDIRPDADGVRLRSVLRCPAGEVA